MYIFRVDTDELGISRDRFIDALAAEGLPTIAGWYHPLYANRVFHPAPGSAEHGIVSPLAGKGVDYTDVRCPVTEQVCRDAVWIQQNILLAPEADISAAADAIEKVVTNARELL
jgi:hypothetical protein